MKCIVLSMSFLSTAAVSLNNSEGFIEFAKSKLKQNGIDYETLPTGFKCLTPLGTLQVDTMQTGLQMVLNCDTEDGLFLLQSTILENLQTFDNSLNEAISWSYKSFKEDDYPPNLTLTKVISKEKVSPTFYRLILKTDDTHRFLNTGMHCRLLLPPREGLPVHRPTVDANGRTKWPKGDEKPHNPVYTIRSINEQEGLMEIDIFIHEGGRACTWAGKIETGSELAIMGPGGGSCPDAEWLLLAGDETALPAIYRILKESKADTEGVVIVRVEDEISQMPLELPAGMTLQWIYRSSDNADALVNQVLSVEAPAESNTFFWFGGEGKDTQKIRQYFQKELMLDKNRYYASTYWKQT